MIPPGEVIFHEEQRFRQPWLWLIVIADAVLMLGLLVFFLVWQGSAGSDARARTVLIIVFAAAAAVSGAIIALLAACRLITEVRRDGLYLRFVPFHRSMWEVPLANVVKVEARTYSPIRDYGGWGLRRTFKGRAYNVSGNRGVRLDFADGRHLLIGSQRPEELAEAIRSISSSRKQ
jgi:hypothetical protein